MPRDPKPAPDREQADAVAHDDPDAPERRPAPGRIGLRVAKLEERLGGLEGQINELAAAISGTEDRLEQLRREREADQELIAVLTDRFRTSEARKAGRGGLLDVNAASFEELRGTGISAAQAARVIAAREAVGGFSSLDELDALPGFRPARLKALKGAVRI